jgi:hypothetical protein
MTAWERISKEIERLREESDYTVHYRVAYNRKGTRAWLMSYGGLGDLASYRYGTQLSPEMHTTRFAEWLESYHRTATEDDTDK